MSESEDLYEILQVHPSAHQDVIRAAFRRLTLLYHPDRNPSQEADEIMTRLNLAYETLSDPGRRAAYDRVRGVQRRQRTEPHSNDTQSGRPHTSRPARESTSQSRTATPTTPPERRPIQVLRKMPGTIGLAVVAVIVVAAVFSVGGRGNSDDGGLRTVAVLPTRTPILLTTTPAQVPTALLVSGATAGMAPVAPTPRPTATATPRPTVTPTPAPTTLPIPTSVLTATSNPTKRDYFTRGSSQADVLHAQGIPTEIQTYEVLGFERWYYDRSRVKFSLPDRQVTEWDNEGNLNVQLLPKTSESSTLGHFTRGSSQADVLHAQGIPTEIQTYEVLGFERWYYDRSRVKFSLPDRRVTEWD